MQITRFRPLALAGISLALAFGAPLASYAQSSSTFLLQLGQHPSKDAAASQWKDLQKQFPAQLGKLSLYLAPVRSVDGNEVFRTQAAGVTTYAQAQSVCFELLASNVNCTVVETSMYQPENLVAGTNAAPLEPVDGLTVEEGTVTASNAAPTIAPATEADKSFGERYMPWFNKTDADEETEAKTVTETPSNAARAEAAAATASLKPQRLSDPEPVAVAAAEPAPAPVAAPVAAVEPVAVAPVAVAPAARPQSDLASRAPRNLADEYTARQPEVQAAPVNVAPQTSVYADAEVSEAVQVPLTYAGGPSADVVPVNKPVGFGGFPSQPADSTAPWIQIGNFTNKEAAFAYSRELSREHPEIMQFTRVRVISPFSQGRSPGSRQLGVTAIRLGPLKDNPQAQQICSVAKAKGLQCTSVREVGTSGTSVEANAPRARSNTQDSYARRATVNRGYSRTAGAQPSGAYWVQLGAFDNAWQAQDRWGQLQGTYKDILGRLQPQVSYPALSSSTTPVYHLRTGPFVNKVGAMDLCSQLQSRRIGCVVVQAR